jgi:LemA protein
MTGLIIVAVVGGVILYAIYLYNSLVKNRQMTEEGWSGIDVQLKRRTDLIPNLLAAVKGYMTHERGLLEEITELRSRSEAAQGADPAERAKVEGLLSNALVQLKAVMENYPDLKANENVMDFQNALEEIENEIQMSRRYYNGAVRNLNVLVESFPSNLVAGQFGFAKAEYFELENAADRAVPKVEF